MCEFFSVPGALCAGSLNSGALVVVARWSGQGLVPALNYLRRFVISATMRLLCSSLAVSLMSRWPTGINTMSATPASRALLTETIPSPLSLMTSGRSEFWSFECSCAWLAVRREPHFQQGGHRPAPHWLQACRLWVTGARSTLFNSVVTAEDTEFYRESVICPHAG